MDNHTVSSDVTPEPIKAIPHFLKWLLISLAVAGLAGSASAALLASLEWATAWRESHFWVLALLPVGGFAVGWLYLKLGRKAERGNNLLIDEIHDPTNTLPGRMTPLVFVGTVVSHLFGASVGREGTAVQMGGSLADQLSRPLRLSPEERRMLIMCGISAGFGSIFGVPMAGAVFGLEVLSIGRIRYDAIFPCFVASVVGDMVTRAWGIHHSAYPVGLVPALTLGGLGKALAAGALFGLVGMLFARCTHSLGAWFKKRIPYAPLRPFFGGLLVLLMAGAVGSTAYLGLGVPEIVRSFTGRVSPFDFGGKFAFTVASLAAGFKGGEVTPLFYIGATLGNALAPLLALPAALLAGMGLVGVFAGAANTPLASTLMAFELFGPQAGVFAGIACVASYLFSGHSGIYHSQRVGQAKPGSESVPDPVPDLMSLHPLGFEIAASAGARPELHSLRLFFHHEAKAAAKKGMLGALSAPSLGEHLMREARAAGFSAALSHAVSAGWLDGGELAFDVSDIPPARLPQCVEIVGERSRLEAFARGQRGALKGVRVVLLPHDAAPLVDKGTDKLLEEIEGYFASHPMKRKGARGAADGLGRSDFSLRLLFNEDALAQGKGTGLRSRIFPARLRDHLARAAKKDGEILAVFHTVSSGWLRHGELTHDSAEVRHGGLPCCVELVGERTRVLAFVRRHRHALGGALAFAAPRGVARSSAQEGPSAAEGRKAALELDGEAEVTR